MDENKYKRTKKRKWMKINTRGQRKGNGRKSIQEDKEKEIEENQYKRTKKKNG